MDQDRYKEPYLSLPNHRPGTLLEFTSYRVKKRKLSVRMLTKCVSLAYIGIRISFQRDLTKYQQLKLLKLLSDFWLSTRPLQVVVQRVIDRDIAPD